MAYLDHSLNYIVPPWGHYPVVSLDKGSSAKNCPWVNFRSKDDWERNTAWYLNNYVIYDDRSKDLFKEAVKRFELDRKWDMEIDRLNSQLESEMAFISQLKVSPAKQVLACSVTTKTGGHVPSLAEQHRDIGKGFSFKDPSAKLPEKPLNDTHPTVLTWLIRYVDLQDILDLFYFLRRIGEDQTLRLPSGSLVETFKTLGFTKLYLIPDFHFNRLAEKYIERPPIPEKGDYEPLDIVDPIIK